MISKLRNKKITSYLAHVRLQAKQFRRNGYSTTAMSRIRKGEEDEERLDNDNDNEKKERRTKKG